jgi:hypothetical protein
MLSSILLVSGAIVAWFVIKTVTGIRRNIALAKSTGLKYYVVRKLRCATTSAGRIHLTLMTL